MFVYCFQCDVERFNRRRCCVWLFFMISSYFVSFVVYYISHISLHLKASISGRSTGGTIMVHESGSDKVQGDVAFANNVMEQIGAMVTWAPDSITSITQDPFNAVNDETSGCGLMYNSRCGHGSYR